MKTLIVIAAAAVALTACGKAAPLKPAVGAALPEAPYGGRAAPTSDQLLTPTAEARPARSDELLKRSEPRQPDEFELPPE